MDTTKHERNNQIVILRNQGKTFREIAELFGVSKPLCAFIYNRERNRTIKQIELEMYRDIPLRTSQKLRVAGLSYTKVISMTPQEILSIKGFGRKTFNDVYFCKEYKHKGA